jgi:hypothetical protein
MKTRNLATFALILLGSIKSYTSQKAGIIDILITFFLCIGIVFFVLQNHDLKIKIIAIVGGVIMLIGTILRYNL